ncbi:MAG: pyruvate kinase [Deltaproteobacteria bacterium]|nr:pyruvate kinase [Deltaproteobacteria bacterium]
MAAAEAGGSSLPTWDPATLGVLIAELDALVDDAVELEARVAADLGRVHPEHRSSARNLVHYLALRRRDIRALQKKLAALGLSSLGRIESHVLGNVLAVRCILGRLAGIDVAAGPALAVLDYRQGKDLLHRHTDALLGPRPPSRTVRVMVTMPGEAAGDAAWVRSLVANGMDCMRINCAHDGPAEWPAMIAHARAASAELGQPCKVLMDLAGPKLRTGAVGIEGQVLKWRPLRDRRGLVLRPARVWLTAREAPVRAPAAAGTLLVPGAFLSRLRRRTRLRLEDLRGKRRVLRVVERGAGGVWAEASATTYLDAARPVGLTRVALGGADEAVEAQVGPLPPDAEVVLLEVGDTLVVTRDPVPGRGARRDRDGRVVEPARIPCSLPEVFGDVRAGEPIWFDDGKIGGEVTSAKSDYLVVRITHADPGGAKLRADKGINLPDTQLRLPALTAEDLENLGFVARHADLVGLSFVKHPDDVRTLHRALDRLGAGHLGVVLKIETRAAFDRLPKLLLAALARRPVGVMIARGDLAVECGYERRAEMQEEILWLCEAAHVPVIWATQVLESLAKDGRPSRAEITDAAMSERAECVMLNKGPHLLDAVHVLDDILRRMEAHQNKKRSMLRPLRLSALVG